MHNREKNLLRQIADYQRLSGIFWIILGVVQACLLITLLAGIWNIFAGCTRLNIAKHILARDSAVPGEFEGIAGLVVIAVVNLLFGGIIGLVFVGFDFFIRDKVMSSTYLFTSATEFAGGSDEP